MDVVQGICDPGGGEWDYLGGAEDEPGMPLESQLAIQNVHQKGRRHTMIAIGELIARG